MAPGVQWWRAALRGYCGWIGSELESPSVTRSLPRISAHERFEAILQKHNMIVASSDQLVESASATPTMVDGLISLRRKAATLNAEAMKVRDGLVTDGTWNAPNELLDDLDVGMNVLVNQLNDIHKESTQGQSLAQAGVEAFKIIADESRSAMTFHRAQAHGLFVWMLVLLAAAIVAVMVVFSGWWQTWSQAASSPATTTDQWLHAVLILGGRISIIVGAGWALVSPEGYHHAQLRRSGLPAVSPP